MKIALFTIWHCGNFGAEMQAYATVKKLTELGHTVEIVDFRIHEREHKSLKNRLLETLEQITPAYHGFRRFWKKHFPNVSRHYHRLSDLKKNPPEADVYLVGSDQVWNPVITSEKAEAFFLDFAPAGTILASFSSSFGSGSWQGDARLTRIARQQFPKFRLLCCREQSGVDILKSEFGIDASHTVDPTLLFSDYNELTGPIEEKDTLVYYPLYDNPELEQYCISLASRLGLKFVNINKKTMLTNTVAWRRTDIIDWICEIAGARLVITPSFHGLAFSLIYKRNFIIVENNVNKNRSTRITDLLDRLNLTHRFFTSAKEVDAAEPWIKDIDFRSIEMTLDSWRNKSHKLLKHI